jgi:hypothetical protein
MRKILAGIAITLGILAVPIAVAASGVFFITQGGTATSSFVQGLVYSPGGTTALNSTATTSVTCSGSTSCTGFTVLGNSPITISSSGGSGAAYAFYPFTNFGTTTSATSSSLMTGGAFFASSTVTASQFPYASTTALSASGTIYANNFFDTSLNGNTCVSESSSLLVGSTYCVTSVSGNWPVVSSGGTNPVISWAGIASSTNLVTSDVWYSTGVNTFGQAATTTVTCAGSVSCTTFNILGSSPITLTGNDSGTVTSIVFGNGLNGGTVTTSGTVSVKNYISTSSAETATYVPFWTSTAGNPASLSGGVSGFTFASTGNLLTATNASTTNLTAGTSLGIPSSSNPSPTIAGYITQSSNSPYQIHIGNGGGTTVFDPRVAFTLGVSTTTTWTATSSATSLPVFTFPAGTTVSSMSCTIQPSGATMEAEWTYANPSTYASVSTYLAASSTPGIVTLSSNNVPAVQATSTIQFGAPTGSPTSGACTFVGTTAAI